MTNGQRVEALKLFVGGYMAHEIADKLDVPVRDIRSTISQACGVDETIYACHKYPEVNTSQYTYTDERIEHLVLALWG